MLFRDVIREAIIRLLYFLPRPFASIMEGAKIAFGGETYLREELNKQTHAHTHTHTLEEKKWVEADLN